MAEPVKVCFMVASVKVDFMEALMKVSFFVSGSESICYNISEHWFSGSIGSVEACILANSILSPQAGSEKSSDDAAGHHNKKCTQERN